MASILVTSIQTFAAGDINDKPITCSFEESQTVIMPLLESYDQPKLEDKIYAAAYDIQKEISDLITSTNAINDKEPEEMATLIKDSVCFLKLSGKEKFDAEFTAQRDAKATELLNSTTKILAKLPKENEGDHAWLLANLKMIKANRVAIATMFLAFQK